MTFEEMGLDERLLQILARKNFRKPTPVQALAIPKAVAGIDIVGLAQTGTGKTLGYVLPALTRLAAGKIQKNSMLVLVPTRELAVQVHGVVEEMGRPLGIRSLAVYGGVSLDNQRDELKEGRQVIVATPGRLLDHMRRRNIDFNNLMVFVLDEADRMLDMGFLPDIKRIVRKLPQRRQTMMFSATMPDEIAYLTDRLMEEPERVEVGIITKPVETVRQTLYAVRPEDKTNLLFQVLEQDNITSAVIFLHTRIRTERLAKALRTKGFSVAQIHGDRSQPQREQALKGFREGKYRILVATDIAARGLDIEGVSHIINFDIPPSADDYIHRVGRTARAEAEGDAITFVCPNDLAALEKIEATVGRRLPRQEWEGAPPILSLYTPKEEKPKETKPVFGSRNRRVVVSARRRRR